MLHVDRGYPLLTVKAWNGQLLLAFLDVCLEVLQKRQPGDLETYLAFMCTRALVCWFDRLVRYPRLLSPEQGRDIAYFGFRFIRLYKRLAVHGVINKLNRWKLIPKCHPFRHMQEDMCRKLYNVRFMSYLQRRRLCGCDEKIVWKSVQKWPHGVSNPDSIHA